MCIKNEQNPISRRGRHVYLSADVLGELSEYQASAAEARWGARGSVQHAIEDLLEYASEAHGLLETESDRAHELEVENKMLRARLRHIAGLADARAPAAKKPTLLEIAKAKGYLPYEGMEDEYMVRYEGEEPVETVNINEVKVRLGFSA